ncbi:hypothetical protein AA103196_0129 [Ameyamaea chiangmaiensis NBRC 103196]|uniref:TIGR02300 family protein n=1 Tax=Ameyamaea chiangmaiensis TaxID=442969 RepID=A0A850PEA5_9PROT|nr:TIGR02300 family protein [Ameyamaea chiangmaiensis]MBS4075913.1 TIGR02300 family protein [Ameyamaea chiangmaiensis]NVN40596.1 TIGR02300 family protein [Ameyamaea chiangmaiensis]GBQ61754.1 hypothetical protein AA103196_0129 [Ameyamaea chiangmaiensis NBRC 103196]
MAAPELGLKRVCVSCGARFYDLTRSPAVCPKCGAEQPTEQPRVRRPVDVVQPASTPKPEAESGTDADIESDDDSEDDLEDASVLDDDDDDDDLGNEIEVSTDSDDNDN